jgi:hypothetical protein
MPLPPAPAGPAAKNAKLVATLVLCSPGRTPLLPLRHRHPRLDAGRLRKICLRECSWPPIRAGSGCGRRVRPPRAGNSTSVPCPLENLVPSYLCFLFDTVFLLPARESILLSPRTLPPESKRRPRKIRNAQPGTCQGYGTPQRCRSPVIWGCVDVCPLQAPFRNLLRLGFFTFTRRGFSSSKRVPLPPRLAASCPASLGLDSEVER